MPRQDWRCISPQLDGGVVTAPSRADVSVAMGITSTEIAGSAAKIIITVNIFCAIMGAFAQGRVVYRNLKKVIL